MYILRVKTIFIVCGVSVGTLFCAVVLGVKTLFILCGVFCWDLVLSCGSWCR